MSRSISGTSLAWSPKAMISRSHLTMHGSSPLGIAPSRPMAVRDELDDPARAVLRRPRRPKRTWSEPARRAGARFRIVRTLAIGVRGDGQSARRRLRMGAVVMVAARPQARQPMGVRSLPHIGGRHAD